MISDTSKTLLKNIIKHTDTHNRIVEETEMWKCYTVQKERIPTDKRHHSSYQRGMQSTIHQVPRAHMDRDLSSTEQSHNSTYWKRKLQEMEEKDPDRWGHAGYKELYPEQFLSDSDRSFSSSSSSESDRKRSKCKRKKVEKSHKKKKKHKSKEKKQKKHKSRRKSVDCQWIVKNVDRETKH